MLFRRGVGRYDLPGGSWRKLKKTIEERLFVLPDDTVVYPGHGPPTTIGEERRENPFLVGYYTCPGGQCQGKPDFSKDTCASPEWDSAGESGF